MAGITLGNSDPWANIGGGALPGSASSPIVADETKGGSVAFDWMSLGGSFMSGLGGSLGGGKSAGPAMSRADSNQIQFDNSGWVVQFGDGSVQTDRQQLPAIGSGLNTTTLLLVAAGLVAMKLWNKRNK